MKNAFINNVLQSTLDFLNNKQAELLKEVLERNLLEFDIVSSPIKIEKTDDTCLLWR